MHTLTGAMSLLRRCRVNAALTIQLFSQLFHFINMWLFNKLVTEADSGLCSHYWGAILRQQLSHIEAWAEKQGLELAADCHLSRIVQVPFPRIWENFGFKGSSVGEQLGRYKVDQMSRSSEAVIKHGFEQCEIVTEYHF